ncbi:hypothetical protein HGM15179_004708 [Zosterops borbonicus]|uniref:Guanine nucleotide-binding protein subunit gamma n=1 Tax=Zosterops borbonicus TaxID=364589 RepID=A0A8K1GNJ1_9PASS|nr:hypothetical protein HGM15179_004708 [Zosterops borbonicus]
MALRGGGRWARLGSALRGLGSGPRDAGLPPQHRDLRDALRKVSKCSEEIKNYIEERSGEDPLVKGVPEDKNPFKEKGGCVIA